MSISLFIVDDGEVSVTDRRNHGGLSPYILETGGPNRDSAVPPRNGHLSRYTTRPPMLRPRRHGAEPQDAVGGPDLPPRIMTRRRPGHCRPVRDDGRSSAVPASALSLQSRRATSARTRRARVDSRTALLRLSTRDTVVCDTPAALAMARTVAVIGGCSLLVSGTPLDGCFRSHLWWSTM